ncbi:NUDIX domain-containing protein [Arthrobacter sp. H20]|uniref:NUDIX domain-containing protein n=1 Tax=Arthrobacter sp. H20 TaxID=1267981 RepID=UPI00047A8887|nr:NUDIX domain-containing protein [Arthrobacter sp. H20]
MKWTVSAKGVLIDDGSVLLGLNDRHEWELPGGQLEEGESLREAVVREFAEETGLAISAGEVILADIFEVIPGKRVLVIAFRCSALNPRSEKIALSAEHHELAWISVGEIDSLPIPKVYQQAVAAAI